MKVLPSIHENKHDTQKTKTMYLASISVTKLRQLTTGGSDHPSPMAIPLR